MNMAKTQDELNQLKKEYEELNTKLKELSEEELKSILGGRDTETKGGCTVLDCPYSSAKECPHVNYGRTPIKGCKYN